MYRLRKVIEKLADGTQQNPQIYLDRYEQLTALLLDKSRIILWQWHLGQEKMHCVYYNENITGFRETDLPASKFGLLDLIHPAEKEDIIRQFEESINDLYITCRILCADRSYKWICINGSKHPYNNSYLIGTIREIAGEIETIDEIVASKEYLERFAGRQRDRLHDMINEMKKIVYSTSHDLQTPVSIIGAYIDLLIDALDKDDIDIDELVEFAGRIKETSQWMNQILSSLLSYSKIANADVMRSKVNITHIIENIHKNLESSLTERNGALYYYKMPEVYGDTNKLTSLFYNLIHNSIKFAHPDRDLIINITYKIEKSNGDMEYLEVIIEDNGIGFDNKHNNQIFDLFKKLHAKNVYKGPGVGLAICKRIAEQHGGYIKAEGRLGSGAIFTLGLPIKEMHDAEG